MSASLREVGFWRACEGDGRPLPASGSAASPPSREALSYLTSAALVESVELGFSYCRLCSLRGPAMGCANLTDGVFVWPEGLHHYVTVHDVALPPEFEAHIARVLKLWCQRRDAGALLPPLCGVFSLVPASAALSEADLDAMCARIEPLPRGMYALLRASASCLLVSESSEDCALADAQEVAPSIADARALHTCSLEAAAALAAGH